jgi:hypothetical protein
MKAPHKKKKKKKKKEKEKEKKEQAEAYFLRPWCGTLHSPSSPDNSFAKIEKFSCQLPSERLKTLQNVFSPEIYLEARGEA